MRIIHWLKSRYEGEGSTYGFKDVRTDSSGKLYMYLPASGTVKASFGGMEFTGKVEAGKDENVLEREQTSIDYQREVLKNTALYELEYAESEDATTWTRIRAGGEAPLTEILDKQPESATEITLYVRKAAAGSPQKVKHRDKASGKTGKTGSRYREQM